MAKMNYRSAENSRRDQYRKHKENSSTGGKIRKMNVTFKEAEELEILKEHKKVTKWEKEFLESCIKWKNLSWKQKLILKRIKDKVNGESK